MSAYPILTATVALTGLQFGLPNTASSAHDHRLDVKLDQRVTAVPPNFTLKRSMCGLVRHLNRRIVVNLQTQPVLLTSTDLLSATTDTSG